MYDIHELKTDRAACSNFEANYKVTHEPERANHRGVAHDAHLQAPALAAPPKDIRADGIPCSPGFQLSAA
eukprot:CAMPEP_0174296470 /NCGR_PEP_ID=MMETSP0809-20121228/47983_1 /TAXON_ID=73025 ORGANISM="Eutreptiella gymnastica-like, Strain CCMP1594" /NCGR_SAMPLE_ID=MMETSP0809 /ASSEMBLY_ACC=CAM_ASM_000658 /LENGTH=69 /DNA_ID=CAMNT_0015399497 /DNA_START=260 /DNA_END=469 /DNA_ORIENTATION=-